MKASTTQGFLISPSNRRRKR